LALNWENLDAPIDYLFYPALFLCVGDEGGRLKLARTWAVVGALALVLASTPKRRLSCSNDPRVLERGKTVRPAPGRPAAFHALNPASWSISI